MAFRNGIAAENDRCCYQRAFVKLGAVLWDDALRADLPFLASWSPHSFMISVDYLRLRGRIAKTQKIAMPHASVGITHSFMISVKSLRARSQISMKKFHPVFLCRCLDRLPDASSDVSDPSPNAPSKYKLLTRNKKMVKAVLPQMVALQSVTLLISSNPMACRLKATCPMSPSHSAQM